MTDIKQLLNNRNPNTAKWDYGHALLIAGSYGKMGCALLAAEACLRSGAGLITVHIPSRCVDTLQAAFPEAMTSIDPSEELFSIVPPNLERYSAIAIGPGIGVSGTTYTALRALLKKQPQQPLLLDADALNIVASHRDEMLPLLPHNTIITPHEREYARLFGDNDPRAMAERHNIIIVAKRHQTQVFSPDGAQFSNHTGNAGMATAGSGDVLTGIILGLLAQGIAPFDAACCGVSIHGQIGDIATQKQTQASLIASDLIENLKYVSLQ